MDARARSIAVALAALGGILLLGWWGSRERAGSAEPLGGGVGGGGPEVLAGGPSGGSAGEEGGPDGGLFPPGPKPLPGGGAGARCDAPEVDGGLYASEQPPPGYEGELEDAFEYDPEPVERPVPVGTLVLDEAALRSRRRQQAGLLDQQVELLSAQIEEARDRGREDLVHLLEVRRRHLEERRDTLRELSE